VNVAGASDVITPSGGKLGSERADGGGGRETKDAAGKLSGGGNIPADNDGACPWKDSLLPLPCC